MPRIDDDDELSALRRRAYAPGADISADPAALRRLIELESRDGADDPAPPVPEAADEPSVPSDAEEPPVTSDPPRQRFRMPRLRRSTTILLTAAALVVVCAATALVLVQRVQTDPLQVGATQIARLAADPDFDVPASLTRGVTSAVTAYAEFEGFRVITYAPFEADENAARCMTVWQPDLLEVSNGGFSYDGRLFLDSCGAGIFPAEGALQLTEDSAEIRATDLPPGTALQFVYDAPNDEIVVFRD